MRLAGLTLAFLFTFGCGGSGNAGDSEKAAGTANAGGQTTTTGGANAGSAQGGSDAPGGGGATSSGGDVMTGGGGLPGVGGANTVPAAGCPTDGTPCPVMCVGDSITWGVTDIGFGHGGYRAPLFHLANQDSKLLTYVGTLNDATEMNDTAPATIDGKPFPGKHEGHPGWVIQQIIDIIAASIKANHPRVILLMIGTNDMAANFDPPTAPQRLGNLLDTISNTDPSITVVLAQITPSQDDALNPKIQAYNAAMPALVKARLDAGRHVSLVDMYSGFLENAAYKTEFLQNTLHPTDAGYAKMADVWYAGLSDMLSVQK